MTNKEAIYIINNRLNTYYCTDEDLQALDLAIKALEDKPQGEWTFNIKWQDYECNKCHEWTRKRHGELPNFCPNCGADMRGTENGK